MGVQCFLKYVLISQVLSLIVMLWLCVFGPAESTTASCGKSRAKIPSYKFPQRWVIAGFFLPLLPRKRLWFIRYICIFLNVPSVWQTALKYATIRDSREISPAWGMQLLAHVKQTVCRLKTSNNSQWWMSCATEDVNLILILSNSWPACPELGSGLVLCLLRASCSDPQGGGWQTLAVWGAEAEWCCQLQMTQ